MKHKMMTMFFCLGFVLLTFIVLLFTLKIQIHVPAQLHVRKEQTYLLVNSPKDLKIMNSKKVFHLFDDQSKKKTIYFKMKRSNLNKAPVIFLKNPNSPYKEGKYDVKIFLKSVTLAQHYFGI